MSSHESYCTFPPKIEEWFRKCPLWLQQDPTQTTNLQRFSYLFNNNPEHDHTAIHKDVFGADEEESDGDGDDGDSGDEDDMMKDGGSEGGDDEPELDNTAKWAKTEKILKVDPLFNEVVLGQMRMGKTKRLRE